MHVLLQQTFNTLRARMHTVLTKRHLAPAQAGWGWGWGRISGTESRAGCVAWEAVLNDSSSRFQCSLLPRVNLVRMVQPAKRYCAASPCPLGTLLLGPHCVLFLMPSVSTPRGGGHRLPPTDTIPTVSTSRNHRLTENIQGKFAGVPNI